MQRMGSKPILRVNINVTIDTMLKVDANANENMTLTPSVNRPYDKTSRHYAASNTVNLISSQKKIRCMYINYIFTLVLGIGSIPV